MQQCRFSSLFLHTQEEKKKGERKKKKDKKRVRERELQRGVDGKKDTAVGGQKTKKKKDPTAAKRGRKKWDKEETELDKGGVIHQLLL